MKITYTGQSSFVVEWDSCFWIFDYAGGGKEEDSRICRTTLLKRPAEKEGFFSYQPPYAESML